MSDDALIASLRSLARFEHADLSIGDEAADALEEAYAYAVRLFSALAPQCEPLPDLIGVLTQIDNATTVIPPMRATIGDHERALRAIVRTVSIAKAHSIAGNALARMLDKGTAAKPPTFAGSSVGRYECPTCDGGGEVAPDFECPDCDGTGYCVPHKEAT